MLAIVLVLDAGQELLVMRRGLEEQHGGDEVEPGLGIPHER